MELTLAAMDAGGVDQALRSAWHGPQGALIANDEVAAFVARAPEPLVGIAPRSTCTGRCGPCESCAVP